MILVRFILVLICELSEYSFFLDLAVRSRASRMLFEQVFSLTLGIFPSRCPFLKSDAVLISVIREYLLETQVALMSS